MKTKVFFSRNNLYCFLFFFFWVADANAIASVGCDETVDIDGARYIGCQTQTQNGFTCQNWLEQSPHEHKISALTHPNKGIGNHNYCRNPDGERQIWCYTNDYDHRWDFCDPLPSTASNLLSCNI